MTILQFSMRCLLVGCLAVFVNNAAAQMGTSVIVKSNANTKSSDTINSFSDVERIVHLHFESQPDFEKGDLLTSNHATALFASLEKSGWKVSNRDEILVRVISTGSYLDRTLNSPSGKKFFRQVSSNQNGVDRVERILEMPHGKKSIHRIMYEIPRGPSFIKALATTDHGKRLGWQSTRSSYGTNFNKPTGRIYTVDTLLKELKKSFLLKPKVAVADLHHATVV